MTILVKITHLHACLYISFKPVNHIKQLNKRMPTFFIHKASLLFFIFSYHR